MSILLLQLQYPFSMDIHHEEYYPDYNIEHIHNQRTHDVLLIVGGYDLEQIPNYFELVGLDGKVKCKLQWAEGLNGLVRPLLSPHNRYLIFEGYAPEGLRIYCVNFETCTETSIKLNKYETIALVTDEGIVTTNNSKLGARKIDMSGR